MSTTPAIDTSLEPSQDAIRVGEKWEQTAIADGGKRFKRIIQITGRPTLSSPVNYRIVRNDSATHRKGKHASIRVADLRRKYRHVG